MSFRVACDAPTCQVVIDPGGSPNHMPKGWSTLYDDQERELHFCPKHPLKTKPRPALRRYLRRRRR